MHDLSRAGNMFTDAKYIIVEERTRETIQTGTLRASSVKIIIARVPISVCFSAESAGAFYKGQNISIKVEGH